MSGKKISELPILPPSQLDQVTDTVVVVDGSAQETKRMRIGDMVTAVVNPILGDRLNNVQDFIQNNLPDLTPPPTPTGFQAFGGVSNIRIQHDMPSYTVGHGHLETIVYGILWSDTTSFPTFADAQEICRFSGNVTSYATSSSAGWRLWIKWKSVDGALSIVPAGGTNGLYIVTDDQIIGIIDALTGQLNESHLTQELNTRINLIDSDEINSVNYRIAQEQLSRNEALVIEGNARVVADSILNSAIVSESQSRSSVDSILSNVISAGNIVDSSIIGAITVQSSISNSATEKLNTALNAKSSIDSILSNAIATEAQSRTFVDSALSTAMNSTTSTKSDLYDAIIEQSNILDEATTKLNVVLDAMSTDSSNSKIAILNEQTHRVSDDNALSAQTLITSAAVANNVSAIVNESSVRASADTVTTNVSQSIIASNQSSISAILEEKTARTTNDTSVANVQTSLVSSSANNTASIKEQASTLTDAISAVVSKSDILTSTTNNNTAAIQNQEQTYTDYFTSVSTKTDSLASSSDINFAAIKTEQETRTNSDISSANIQTALVGSTSTAIASIQEQSNITIDSLSSVASKTDTLITVTDLNSAVLKSQEQTYTDYFISNASKSDTLVSINDTNSSSILSEQQTRVSQDESLAKISNSILSSTQYGLAAISEEKQTRSTADSVFANIQTSLVSSNTTSNAAIQSQNTTFVNSLGAIATKNDMLLSVTDQNTANIQTQENTFADYVSATTTQTNSLLSSTNANTSAIINESATRSTNDNITASIAQSVVGSSQYGLSAILEEKNIRSGVDGVLADVQTSLISSNDDITASIQEQSNTFTNSFSATASKTDGLASVTGQNTTILQNQEKTYTDYFAAVSNQSNLLASQIGTNASAIKSEQETRTTKDESSANSISQIVTQTSNNASAITTEQSARSTDSSSVASVVNTLVAKTNDVGSAILSEQNVRSTADSTSAETFNTLKSGFDTVNSYVIQEATTRASADNSTSNLLINVISETQNSKASIKSESLTYADGINALAKTIDVLKSSAENSTSAIVNESNARTYTDMSSASVLTGLVSTVGSNAAAIKNEQTNRVTDDTAYSSQLNILSGAVDESNSVIKNLSEVTTTNYSSITTQTNNAVSKLLDNTSAIESEKTTRVLQDESSAKQISGLVAKTGENVSSIFAISEANTNRDESTAIQLSGLTASTGSNISAIQNEAFVRTDKDIATSAFSNALTTSNNLLSSAIKIEADARTTADSTSATLINQVQSRLDTGDYAAVKTLATTSANTLGVVEAQYTVKTEVNGHIAGIGLATTANNATPTSEFTILADKFAIAPVATNVWDSTTIYTVGITVYYEGNTYDCISANTNTIPTNATYWKRSASPFYYLTEQQTINGLVIEPGLYVAKANISKLTADQIDARGLSILNSSGKVILAAGNVSVGESRVPGINDTSSIISDTLFADPDWGILDTSSDWMIVSATTNPSIQLQYISKALRWIESPSTAQTGSTFLGNVTTPASLLSPVVPGEKLYINGKFTSESTATGTTSFYIRYYNATGIFISETLLINSILPQTQYTLSATAIVPATAAFVGYRIRRGTTSAGGTALGWVEWGNIRITRAQDGATKGATWGVDVNSIPYDKIYATDATTTLGFNPSFEAWTNTYPNNWVNWSGVAPTKETTTVRFGSNAVKYIADGTAIGMTYSASWTNAPMSIGTFISGTLDMYLNSVTSGLPGMLVRLWTNSAFTTYVDTKVQPQNITGSWQRIPFTARVGATQQIYGIQIYIMGSWTAFDSGSFTGTVIFDGLTFAFFDSSIDNKSVKIASDGTLSGAGGGAVTITGLGYTGDLDATNTYIDANGNIQGVSDGAGTAVSNALIKVGGKNFMRYSGEFNQAIVDTGWATNGGVVSLDTTTTYGGKPTLKIVGLNGAVNRYVMRLKANTEYTVSALVKGSSVISGGGDAHLHIQVWRDEDVNSVHQDTNISYDQNITTSWKVVYQTFRTPVSANATYCRFYFYPLATNYALNVAYVKLEEGNKVTDWMPAPEDVSSDISNKLNKAGNSILDISINDTTFSTGIRVGDLAWDTNGNRTSGKGLALTPKGILGHDGSNTTFTIDATTGDATFAGTLAANIVDTTNIKIGAVTDTYIHSVFVGSINLPGTQTYYYSNNTLTSLLTNFSVNAGSWYRLRISACLSINAQNLSVTHYRMSMYPTINGAYGGYINFTRDFTVAASTISKSGTTYRASENTIEVTQPFYVSESMSNNYFGISVDIYPSNGSSSLVFGGSLSKLNYDIFIELVELKV